MASVTPFSVQWLQERSNSTNWFHLLLIPSLVISFFFFIFRSLFTSRSKSKILPPSPPTLPIIGNFHQVSNLLHRSLRELSEKHGPIMLLHMGRRPILVISSEEVAREIMKNEPAVLGRSVTTGPTIALEDARDIAFSPYGEFWRQARKICVLDMLSVKRVQSFQSIREEEISLLMEKVHDSCSSRRPVNLSELLLSLSTNISSRCAFGKKFEEEHGKNRFGELARELTALFGGFFVGDFFPMLGWLDGVIGLNRKLGTVMRELNAFLDKILDEHSIKKEAAGAQGKHDVFVDILLHTRSAAEKREYNFTRKDMRGIILDMIVGGIDTSATTIEWALAELIKNPKVMKKAQEEIRRVVGKKSFVSEEDIKQMNYLNCVIKETLRLHPPAPTLIPRVTTTSFHINGYFIPSNIPVLVNAWAIQTDPKAWEKPNEFIPERFMGKTTNFLGQDFKLIPFGFGRRICPGLSFAVAILETTVANCLYFFDWELPNGVRGEDIDMSEMGGSTTHKKIPLLLVSKISKDV